MYYSNLLRDTEEKEDYLYGSISLFKRSVFVKHYKGNIFQKALINIISNEMSKLNELDKSNVKSHAPDLMNRIFNFDTESIVKYDKNFADNFVKVTSTISNLSEEEQNELNIKNKIKSFLNLNETVVENLHELRILFLQDMLNKLKNNYDPNGQFVNIRKHTTLLDSIEDILYSKEPDVVFLENFLTKLNEKDSIQFIYRTSEVYIEDQLNIIKEFNSVLLSEKFNIYKKFIFENYMIENKSKEEFITTDVYKEIFDEYNNLCIKLNKSTGADIILFDNKDNYLNITS